MLKSRKNLAGMGFFSVDRLVNKKWVFNGFLQKVSGCGKVFGIMLFFVENLFLPDCF